MNLQTLISSATRLLIGELLPITVAAAVLVFFWGLFQSIAKGGDKNAAESARNLMVWGILALFVMLSAWGLVKFIQSGLNLNLNPL
ncbi:hypothetical protein KW784_02080 [Candidatus Parcubacteria bacterium]|nr:hypothetical protein [Candidatus Parcubacteria bacterium]